jgi:hypothetical protein
MSMSKRQLDFALIAAGLGLWYVGAKTFADHHQFVAVGAHDDFQSKYASTIGTGATVAGLALAVYGTYRVNPMWGKGLGVLLGGVVAYNIYKHKQGEPLISLSPFSVPSRLFAGV